MECVCVCVFLAALTLFTCDPMLMEIYACAVHASELHSSEFTSSNRKLEIMTTVVTYCLLDRRVRLLGKKTKPARRKTIHCSIVEDSTRMVTAC